MPASLLCPCGNTLLVPDDADDVSCPKCGRLIPRPLDSSAAVDSAAVREFVEGQRRAAAKPQSAVRTPPVPDEPILKRVFEALLDPQAIQYLLGLGGALAVVGLIVWLVSIGLFANPWVQAGLFAVGTLGLLAAGWFVTLRTRYRLAGIALTALGCVVAPLNLWFYHAQNLMTVEGHLWAAAIVCCGLYAATLWRLREPVFVYAFQAGMVMTALLLLADLGRLNDATAVAATLVAFGVIAIHLERLFPPAGTSADGQPVVFDRQRYGRPLIYSGFVQIGGGLAVLLAAQTVGWLRIPTDVIQTFLPYQGVRVAPFLAAGLWLAGAYAAFYAALVPRLSGPTLWAAACCLLMAEVTLLATTEVPPEAAIVALAVTAAVACVAGRKLPEASRTGWAALAAAGLLAAMPVGLGYVLFLRDALPGFREVPWWHRDVTWDYVGAMGITAACLYAAAMVTGRRVGGMLQAAGTAAVLLGGAGAVRLIGPALWPQRAALLMLVPLAYLIYGLIRRNATAAAMATGLVALMATHFAYAVAFEQPRPELGVAGAVDTLWLALALFEVAAFFLLAAMGHGRDGRQELTAPTAAVAAGPLAGGIGLLLAYFAATAGWTAPVFAVVSVGLLAAAAWLRPTVTFSRPLFFCGATLLLSSVAAVGFRGLGMVAAGHAEWFHANAAGVMVLAALAAAALGPISAWRRAFVAAAASMVGVGLILLADLADLSGWQKVEILAIVAGIAMLLAGHVGRFRERLHLPDEFVTSSLRIGSLLAVIPPAIAVIWYRFYEGPSLPDELVFVTITVLMLASGLAFRVLATTVLGGVGLAAYLLMLVVTVLHRPQTHMGVYLVGAGIALFLLGVALSIYRDRLIALPDQIARREGVFRVLDWR